MEWKHVFMIQCTDGAFPKYAKYDHDPHNDKDYLEELRCFYVAITRAKEFLHIIAPITLSIYGKTITGNVAHFLDHSMDAMQPGRLPILPEESLSFAFVPRSLREKGLQSALNYTEWDSLQTISILKRNAAFVVKKLLPCMYRSFGTMTTKIISNC